MYQFGLSPATAEVPSMSAVALGANRWASRVVVVLQLAAWSAVGIVLLQKGVSSLQKTPLDVRNVTKVNYTETTVANLMMKRIPVEITGDLIIDDKSRDRGYDSNVEIHGDSKNTVRPKNRDSISEEKAVPGVIPLSSLTPNHLSVDKKGVPIREKSLFQNRQDSDEEKREEEEEEEREEMEKSTVSSSTSTEKYEKISEARKKLHSANLGGGGAAAAAVAMVAVGAVMLVLGPVVIILRALDERRQERRFLKLSGQDDLPPSYEQATLMDEAPRYSTLSLNTISCSPAAEAAAAARNSVSDSATAEIVREV